MSDSAWCSVVCRSLWLAGLTLISMATSCRCWAQRASRRSCGRDVGLVHLPFDLGGLLLASGLFLGADFIGQRACAALAAMGFLGLIATGWVRSPRAAERSFRPLQRQGPVWLVAWRHGLVAAGLTSVMLTLAPPPLPMLGPALLIVLLAVGWLGGAAYQRTPADLPLLLLLAMALVGVVVSIDADLSAQALRGLMAGVTLYLAATSWAVDRQRVLWGAEALVRGGVLLAILAPVVSTSWQAERLLRVPTLLSRWAFIPWRLHPNTLAGTLVLVIPVALAQFSWLVDGGGRRVPLWLRQTVLGLACCGMAVMVVLTQSRGGLLGLAAGLALWIWQRWRPARLATPVLLGAAGLAVVASGYGGELVARLQHVLNSSWVQGRLELWSRALYMLADFPITGIGLGTYQRILPLLYPCFLSNPDVPVPHPHNLLLAVGVDLGLPGLVAFAALLLLGLAMAFDASQHSRNPRLRFLASGLLASLVALSAHGLVDAPAWGPGPSVAALAAWAVIGLTSAVWHIAQEDRI